MEGRRIVKGEILDRALMVAILGLVVALWMNIDGQIDDVAQKVAHLDGQVELVAQNVVHLEGQVDSVAQNVAHLDAQVDLNAGRLEAIDDDLGDLREATAGVTFRVDLANDRLRKFDPDTPDAENG